MANHFSHACLPYPIRGAKYTIAVPFSNPNGETPTFDTKVSKDNGAIADATEEVAQITGTSSGIITLTATEMTAALVILSIAAISGQPTTEIELKPMNLPVIATGTATAGGGSTITLAASARGLKGGIVIITSGTGSGQARPILSVSGNVVTVSQAWETNPDNTSVYNILQTEFMVDPAEVGDALLIRSVSNVEASAPKESLATVVLAMTHSSMTASPGNLRIFRSNGSTTHYDIPVTSNAAAEPITSVN